MKKTVFGVTIAGASALLLGFIFNEYDFTTYSLATTTFLGFIYGIYNKVVSEGLKDEVKVLEMEIDDVNVKLFDEMRKKETKEKEVELLNEKIKILEFPVIDTEEAKASKRRKKTTKNTK